MSQLGVEGFRLSPPQRSLWRRHGVVVGPYRVTAVVSIRGPLSPDALAARLQALAARHEILRTTYRSLAGMKDAIQVVTPERAFDLHVSDLQGFGADAQAVIQQEATQALAGTPFDLEQGPLWRVRYFVASPADATLVLSAPAIAADAESVAIVVRDLAGAGGRAQDELPMQHVDIGEWQHDLLAAEGAAAGREFWRGIDRQALAACRLSLRRQRRDASSFVPRAFTTSLPAETVAAASHYATSRGCTVQDVFLAAWQLLMWRLADGADLVVGIGADGRPLPDLGDGVGPLARLLPVRLPVDRTWSFAELIDRSRASRFEHVRWQSLFDWETAGDSESAGFCPLAFEALAVTPIAGDDGVTWTVEHVEACGDRVELKLSLLTAADTCRAVWTFDEGVHTSEQVSCVADQYVAVLRAAMASPSRLLTEIDIRGDWERRHPRLTPIAWPAGHRHEGFRAVHEVFADHAARLPHRRAATCGGEHVSYGELNARANGIAACLRANGVGPESRVGILLDHSIDLLAAILGVLKAGAAFVPLPPDQPVARLAALAVDAGARLVVTHGSLGREWPAAATPPLLWLDADSNAIAAAADPPEPVQVGADHLAYVMFTSGSTGEPKGVMIPHAALAHYVEWGLATYLTDEAPDVVLHSSIGFDATLTSLFVPLCGGAHVVIAPEGDGVDGLVQPAASSDGRGFLKLTPAHLALVTARVSAADLGRLPGRLVIGGEALSGEQLAAWRTDAPATQIVNEYGPTEATVGCLVSVTPAAAIEPGPISIGYPIADLSCHAVDGFGHPAAVGVTGELYVGGVQLARGYHARPELTAERFTPDATAAGDGARCYRTGDLVRLRPDGALDYIGRRDHQVKVRGHRVELGEIEVALRRQPNIGDAAVVLREDTAGDRRLVAYVVGRGAFPIESDGLQQALRSSLPDYMIPALVVALDALPLTANGKVDRRRLPVPDGHRPRLAQDYIAPRTEAETILARIWAEVLRVDRVGIRDNFFALGGDSILSLQIVSRAARAGLRLAPRLVFEHHTIEALAEAARRVVVAPADQQPVTGAAPLTPIQHWFFAQPVGDRHHYNQALALDLVERVPPPALLAAWRGLQEHHDALRLRFVRTDTGWEQVNAGIDAATPATVVDATGVREADRERLWARVARGCQTSLDLEHGPIARVALVDWGGSVPQRALIVLHHLVADGVSWRVLLEDLQELCRSAAAGAPADLPPKTTSFKAWAATLASFVERGGFDAEVPLWIAASQPGALLPRDHATGANLVASQRTIGVSFSAEETDALLHHLPGELGVHVQEVLLTALVMALARWTGRATWRVELEGHGRETLIGDEDVSRTVGWFTTTYPVRLSASGDDPVASLRAVRAALRAVPRYGIGFGALRHLRTSAEVGPLAEADAAEIIFNYWGQLDQVFAASTSIRPAQSTVGPTRSPRQLRSHLFELSASVVDARLQVGWTYGADVHDQQTIERLADGWRDAVRRLSALRSDVRARLQTPADFPLARITAAELDRLLDEGGAVRDIYPLSPMQEGLLFHRLLEGDGALYSQQFAVRLRGPLDAAAFQRAWNDVVARHDVLRTAFVWDRQERPLQIVREQAAVPWTEEDWRTLGEAEREHRLAAWLETDRRRGFSLEHPPLMRVGLIRLADDQWQVSWTSHHLILDGWSMPLVVGDVLRAYTAIRAGERPPAEPLAGRYADYIAWLQTQSDTRAEDFWRRTLDGVTTATLVATAQAPHSQARFVRETLRVHVPAALVDALQRLAGGQRITMNTCFAGAWGLMLAHRLRQRDVVFGTVVSGRPPDLPGIEAVAGLFVNTQPLRLEIAPSTPALAWLAECQRRQVDAREFEYASLSRVQSWSTLPAGSALFDTLFAYENYPVDHAWRQQTELRIEQATALAPTDYPLEVEVAGAASELVITVAFDPERLSPSVGRFFRDGFVTILSRLVSKPGATIADLLESLDDVAPGPDAANAARLRLSRESALRALRQTGAARRTTDPELRS